MLRPQRVSTGFVPTPLHEMTNLTHSVGKARLLIKRDDLTGLAGGGNKTRKLDYLIREALDQGCTTILTYGGPQTNHGRLTIAAARRFGLKAVLMCYGRPPEYASGNIALNRIMGAEMVFMDSSRIRELPAADQAAAYYRLRDQATTAVVDRHARQGDRVYIIPIGGHSLLGTLGYVDVVREIMGQLDSMGSEADYLVTTYGSSGTFAGLYLGAKLYGAPFRLIGITVAPQPAGYKARLIQHMNEVSRHYGLGIEIPDDEEISIEEDYRGTAYNVPDAETRQAIYRLARGEGILVDPCYTGKAFRGFLDLVETEKIGSDKTAIFLHTGGIPAIWTKEHLDAMQDEIWNPADIEIYPFIP